MPLCIHKWRYRSFKIYITCPASFASWTPDSARSASNQPQKRFSAFQALSPCLTITTLWAAAILSPPPPENPQRNGKKSWSRSADRKGALVLQLRKVKCSMLYLAFAARGCAFRVLVSKLMAEALLTSSITNDNHNNNTTNKNNENKNDENNNNKWILSGLAGFLLCWEPLLLVQHSTRIVTSILRVLEKN